MLGYCSMFRSTVVTSNQGALIMADTNKQEGQGSSSPSSGSGSGGGTMTIRERVENISRDLQNFDETRLRKVEDFIQTEKNRK